MSESNLNDYGSVPIGSSKKHIYSLKDDSNKKYRFRAREARAELEMTANRSGNNSEVQNYDYVLARNKIYTFNCKGNKLQRIKRLGAMAGVGSIQPTKPGPLRLDRFLIFSAIVMIVFWTILMVDTQHRFAR